MNFRIVINQLGLLLLVISATLATVCVGAMAIKSVTAFEPRNAAVAGLAISSGVGLALGGILWLLTRHGSRHLGRREALLLVAATWFVGGALGGLPYHLWARFDDTVAADHPFNSAASCFFESVSGFTTCGASVLSVVEDVPAILLFWRALTQWLGGLGIVVLFVAVLPTLGVGGKRLIAAEASGIKSEDLMPHIRETARILWKIYLVLTGAQVILLWVAGMSLFDSVCHSFTTLATGGFSTRSASYAYYDSSAINYITIVFMLLGGVNFALYYQLLRRRFENVLRDTELRLYLILLLGISIVAAMIIHGNDILLVSGSEVEGTAAASFEHALFTVVSLITTSGFCTAEYDAWHPALCGLIYFFVFVGGCAGSTSGGIKVARFWVALKLVGHELEREFRPNIVRPIRVGSTRLDPELRLNVISLITAFLLVLAACAALLMVFEHGRGIDMTSAVSGTLACMSTTGPGLGLFGGAENYGWLGAPSKLLLSAAMIVGRLEVMTCLVLFMPRFWRGD